MAFFSKGSTLFFNNNLWKKIIAIFIMSQICNIFLEVGKDEFVFHAFKWQTKIILFKSPNKFKIWKQMSLPKITHLYSDPIRGLLGLLLFLKSVNSVLFSGIILMVLF